MEWLTYRSQKAGSSGSSPDGGTIQKGVTMNCIECGGKYVEVSGDMIMESSRGKGSGSKIRFFVKGMSFLECLGCGERLFSPAEAKLIEEGREKALVAE